MTFTIPIPILADEISQHNGQPKRNLFQVTVKKDEEMLVLNDEEHEFFLQMLLIDVVEFYSMAQTRDSNESLMGVSLRGEGLPGIRMEISVLGSTTYDLPETVCALLSNPKLDCALAA